MDTTPQVATAAPAESAPAQEHIESPSTEGQHADSPAQESQPEQKPEPKAPSRLQQRIDELTRQRYEEQRRADEYAAKLAAYEREQQQAKTFADIDARQPRIEQFQDLHTYTLAMNEWNRQRTIAEATVQWEQREQQRAAEQAQHAAKFMEQQQRVMHENVQLETKMADGAKVYPDFIQAVTNPDLPSTRGTPLFAAVMEADNAVHIAYSLAKNPAELERLLSLRDPVRITREVMKLDAKFTGTPSTSAPPPPPQRNGAAAVPSGKPDPSDTAAWMKWRERDLKEKARRR